MWHIDKIGLNEQFVFSFSDNIDDMPWDIDPTF